MEKNHSLMRMDPNKGFNALSRKDVSLLNPVEFMGLFIWMALVAPDEAKAKMALGEANQIARTLTAKEVRCGKLLALALHKHHGIETLD